MQMVRVAEDTWINAELIERVDLMEDGHVNYWTANSGDNPSGLYDDEAKNFIAWLKDNDENAIPVTEPDGTIPF